MITERTIAFECMGVKLPGILSVPEAANATGTSVVIVVGGPQYRVGAHRQFVLLGRALAAAGHACLRFDYRGMGDAPGEARDFESITEDIAAAVDAVLRELPHTRRVALLGLCDGASASLLYVHERADSRISDLCLLNPWARSETTLAQTHLKHYYTRRLTDGAFWRKLLAGGVSPRRVAEFAGSVARAVRPARETSRETFQQRMAAGWKRFGGRVLLVLSGSRDLTAQEFVGHAGSAPEWQGLLQMPKVRRLDFPAADHTFSDGAAWREASVAMGVWLAEGGARP